MAIRWPLLVRRTHKWLALVVGVQALLGVAQQVLAQHSGERGRLSARDARDHPESLAADRERRGGTEPVPLIAGFAAALRLRVHEVDGLVHVAGEQRIGGIHGLGDALMDRLTL